MKENEIMNLLHLPMGGRRAPFAGIVPVPTVQDHFCDGRKEA